MAGDAVRVVIVNIIDELEGTGGVEGQQPTGFHLLSGRQGVRTITGDRQSVPIQQQKLLQEECRETANSEPKSTRWPDLPGAPQPATTETERGNPNILAGSEGGSKVGFSLRAAQFLLPAPQAAKEVPGDDFVLGGDEVQQQPGRSDEGTAVGAEDRDRKTGFLPGPPPDRSKPLPLSGEGGRDGPAVVVRGGSDDHDEEEISRRSGTTLQNINRCIEKAEENLPKYFYLRGVAHSCVRDFKKAVNEFSICISLDPNYGPAYLEKSKCHFLLGSTEKGFASLKTFMEMHPEDLSIYRWIGDLLYEGLSYRDALKAYSELPESSEADLAVMRAKCLFRVGGMADVSAQLKIAEKVGSLDKTLPVPLRKDIYLPEIGVIGGGTRPRSGGYLLQSHPLRIRPGKHSREPTDAQGGVPSSSIGSSQKEISIEGPPHYRARQRGSSVAVAQKR
ncbi:unnamed protein product [Sphagnum balticum]